MAGVDVTNQFPNSMMAGAVKRGHSRMVSDDQPSHVLTPGLENVSIAAASLLSAVGTGIPAGTTYAALTAVGGPMYVTYDGTVPSSSNYQITVGTGATLPVIGAEALAKIKVQGTSLSASFWS